MTGTINVNDGPRQVVFSPDGSRAYVTAAQDIDVVAPIGFAFVQA